MSPRVQIARVTMFALLYAACASPAIAGDPKLVQKVYPIADLIIPIVDSDISLPPIPGTAAKKAAPSPQRCCGLDFDFGAIPACFDMEIMCQQPGDAPSSPCCQKTDCTNSCPDCPAGCCTTGAAAKSPCCAPKPCCDNSAGCCPSSASPCCEQRGNSTCADSARSNCCPHTGTPCNSGDSCDSNRPCCTEKSYPQAAERSDSCETNKDRLISLLTNTIAPMDWQQMGGRCRIDYYPIGMALVVNAPADVQEQIGCLLHALRRLQDTEVSFDVRLVAMTDPSSVQAMFHNELTQFNDGQPLFLDSRQMCSFLESLQSDARSHTVQAPRLTVFNGQRATILASNEQYFVTGLDAKQFNGQTVYVPKNEAYTFGFQMSVRPTVSADGKFVRCELKAENRELANASVPVYPVTEFIVQVHAGGPATQPIPMTQFVQQPDVQRCCVEKSLAIPDGNTALIYAGRQTKCKACESGDEPAPFFFWLPSFVDLFTPPTPPTTYDEHLFLMVTPKIVTHDAAARAIPMSQAPEVEMIPHSPCCSAPAVCANPPCCHTPNAACAPLAAPTCVAAVETAGTPCRAPAVMPAMPTVLEAPCFPGYVRPMYAQVVPTAAQMHAASLTPAISPQQMPSDQVELEAAIISIEPNAWTQQAAAAWSDFSPSNCENKYKLVTREEAARFIASMKATGSAKLLSQPRLITLVGQQAQCAIGGQQAITTGMKFAIRDGKIVPEFEETPKQFGPSITFRPMLSPDGLNLDIECELSQPTQATKEYRVTIEAPGEQPRTEVIRQPASMKMQQVKCRASMPPSGRASLLMCLRTEEGKDLLALVTPRLTNVTTTQASSPEALQDNAAALPAPLPHPPIRFEAGVPAPAMTSVMPAAVFQVEPTPYAENFLAVCLDRYRRACAAGDWAAARVFAERCLAIDPTCFGK